MTGNDLIQFLFQNIGTFQTAVGSIAGAIITTIFLRRNTATEEFEKIKAGKLGDVVDDLLESGKMTYTEYYRANNFLMIAEKADKEYSSNSQAESAECYDFDWFVRFYEAVGNISNDQMQNIWARILAGEINKPNTYSLRTIEVLKNISQQEAELFGKICSRCIVAGTHRFLPHYDEYLRKSQITFSEILYLSELGLISSDSMLVIKVPIDKAPGIVMMNNDLLMVASSKSDNCKTLEIKQFPLTAVGIELSSLVENLVTNDDFISLAKEINNNASVEIGVHKVVAIRGTEIKYSTTNLLTRTHS